MSSLQLKLDGWVKREPDRSARNIPAKKLTQKMKHHIADKCYTSCLQAYKKRMVSSALLSDFETHKDLDAEAFIAMWNIIEKFDISKCGLIAKFDVPGATNPKTIEFYFKTYFSSRVNFIACESRAFKKQRGVGPTDGLAEISYDAADHNVMTEHNHEYEITGILLKKLKHKEPAFQRFFHQLYQLQCTQRELREEYGEKFTDLRTQMNKFITEVQRENQMDYYGAGY